jgi:hypothetical protein
MISINRVYQKVLAIANKEQRGYITPQEFNLFADKAQMEIYTGYFHRIKNSTMKPSNQEPYADEVEILEEKLHPFHIDRTYNVTTNSLDLTSDPSDSTATIEDIHKLISVTALSSSRGVGNKLTQLNKHQIAYTENNPLTKATLKRSIFVREDANTLTILPSASTSTFNVDSNSDGSNNAESFEVSYYKRPLPPNWTYNVLGGKALYNGSATDLQNFELHPSEEEVLVSRILMLAGVMMKQPDVQQAGIADLQIINQSQNN